VPIEVYESEQTRRSGIVVVVLRERHARFPTGADWTLMAL
jgi:hypothetical protein